VKIREAVGRLKELRAPLISAAVTGKIDVREAVSEVSLIATIVPTLESHPLENKQLGSVFGSVVR
jgi:hypothetical protein